MSKKAEAFPFAGRWAAKDDWETDVEFEITKRGRSTKVAAIDLSDGERAEIYDVKLDGDDLHFAAYWSSGRFTKYRLRLLANNELEAVYTYRATTQFARRTKPQK